MAEQERDDDIDKGSKVYRGPRCGFCHGKMEVHTTGAWSELEGKMIRYRRCLECKLSEAFSERRGK
jgi:hypothetical protein